MALIRADRVEETTGTQGLADFVLAGAVTGSQGFASALADGDTCYYCCVAVNAAGEAIGQWEVGLATFTPGTLERTTVHASSTGEKVDFAAGTKRIFLTASAYDLNHLASLIAGGVAWGDITGTLTDQTDLQAALDAKQAAGSYAATSHTHAQSDVTGLSASLSGKADASHTHAQSDITGLTAALAAKAATSQTTEMGAGFIASPSDKSYKLFVKMAHGGTITETTTISVSGTCTATFKINTTALGGTANSVSSAEQSQSHSSANTFVAGDDIVLTVSSNSSCADMSFSIKYTRVLE